MVLINQDFTPAERKKNGKEEAAIRKYFIAEMKKLGCDCVKLNKRGRPDWLVVPKGMPCFFAELKRETGGNLSDAQCIIINRYRNMGHIVYCPKSFAEIDLIVLAIKKAWENWYYDDN